MSKYMIHAVPSRMWYVEEYLIPSMIGQGIDKYDIMVWEDRNKRGNLRACMDSFLTLDSEEDTWHLQDDVIISSDFRKVTEEQDKKYPLYTICAFCSKMYDGDAPSGIVDITKMWFSFPCIRIYNKFARECAAWCYKYLIGNVIYTKYWNRGFNDDWVFRNFMKDRYPNVKAHNLFPNIVDHVDYLIGGSANGFKRKEHCVSQYWHENDLVENLERRLHHAGT